jgi:hypothetical protein
MNNLKQLTLVVVGKDESSLRRFDLAHIGAAECVLLVNYSKVPLSVIGNRFLDACLPLFGMVHADVSFGPTALDVFADAVESGNVCGVVGWNCDLKPGDPGANPGDKGGRAGEVWCYQNPGPVSTLDSAAVFFRRDLELRFDEKTFDGFHCHVEDLCIQASERGIPVAVPSANATHNSALNPPAEWRSDYDVYYRRLKQKWPHVRFGVT